MNILFEIYEFFNIKNNFVVLQVIASLVLSDF
jgi:hypothetical protein